MLCNKPYPGLFSFNSTLFPDDESNACEAVASSVVAIVIWEIYSPVGGFPPSFPPILSCIPVRVAIWRSNNLTDPKQKENKLQKLVGILVCLTRSFHKSRFVWLQKQENTK